MLKSETARLVDELALIMEQEVELMAKKRELKRALIETAGKGGGALQGSEHVVAVGTPTKVTSLAVRLARRLLEETLGVEKMNEQGLLVETHREPSVRLIPLATGNPVVEGGDGE